MARLLDAQVEEHESAAPNTMSPYVEGHSTWTLLGKIIQEDGILGLWRGYSVELGRVATRVALLSVHAFYVEPFLERYWRNDPHRGIKLPWWKDPRDMRWTAPTLRDRPHTQKFPNVGAWNGKPSIDDTGYPCTHSNS